MAKHDMEYEVCFFFQAEDGIRDIGVTGVQTCALPISDRLPGLRGQSPALRRFPGRDAQRPNPIRRYRRGLRSRLGRLQIGRAACWGRVEILGVAVSLKKKK